MTKNTLHFLWVAAVVMLGSACTTTPVHTEVDRKAVAERYFRGVYGCQPSVIDELAAEEIAVTYPIFQTLFQSVSIRGRQAVKEFAARFCSKWTDARISIDDAVVEGDQVVLVWSFQARDTASVPTGEPPAHQEHRWGGITLFRFDGAGRIVAEIGEESEPGPIARLKEGTAAE
jgi:hypothetical protein